MTEVEISRDHEPGIYEGQLLIATPSLYGSCFARSVVYLCNHNEEGAMGLIINQTLDDIDGNKIVENLDISLKGNLDLSVHFGGPVDLVRGFVLHSPDYQAKDTYMINEQTALSSSLDVLQDISNGDGPKKCLLALGYSGWGAGQLETEIEANSWFTVPASDDLIFGTDNDGKWQKAAESVGVDLFKFSEEAGHA
jgi:putative transcriptional regulator